MKVTNFQFWLIPLLNFDWSRYIIVYLFKNKFGTNNDASWYEEDEEEDEDKADEEEEGKTLLTL